MLFFQVDAALEAVAVGLVSKLLGRATFKSLKDPKSPSINC